MKRCFTLFLAVTLGAGIGIAQPKDYAALTPRPVIKVMTFNIRYGLANDGTNSWPYRAHLVVEAVRTFDPDLLGMQEVLLFQADWLRKQLPEYAFHGVGREDGKTRGEMVPIFYKTNRFSLLQSGHFWLSETPNVPGSRSWDSSLPRMVSWVVLRDLQTGTRFLYMNTHFDHRGRVARAASARLIRQWVQTHAADLPVLLTGDFNSTENSEPYQILVQGRGLPQKAIPWIDAYRVIHPTPTEWEATAHGWRGTRKGRRIDWIIHSPDFVPLEAVIIHYQDSGHYPSDHYPVFAAIRYR